MTDTLEMLKIGRGRVERSWNPKGSGNPYRYVRAENKYVVEEDSTFCIISSLWIVGEDNVDEVSDAMAFKYNDGYYLAIAALNEAAKERGALTAAVYNDTPGRTLEEVLAVFDRAIEIVEKNKTV